MANAPVNFCFNYINLQLAGFTKNYKEIGTNGKIKKVHALFFLFGESVSVS